MIENVPLVSVNGRGPLLFVYIYIYNYIYIIYYTVDIQVLRCGVHFFWKEALIDPGYL